MRLSRKKGGAARPHRTVKSGRFWPFLKKRTMKSRPSKANNAVAQARELMRIEAEIEELNRQATLLEERAYMIRRQQRAAEGNSSESDEFNNNADPDETNRDNVNNLVRNMHRTGISHIRH